MNLASIMDSNRGHSSDPLRDRPVPLPFDRVRQKKNRRPPWTPQGTGSTETVWFRFGHEVDTPDVLSCDYYSLTVRTTPLFLQLLHYAYIYDAAQALDTFEKIKRTEHSLTWDERQMVVREATKHTRPTPLPDFLVDILDFEAGDCDTMCSYGNNPELVGEELARADALVSAEVPPLTLHGWDRLSLPFVRHMIRSVMEHGPDWCQILINRGWCVPSRRDFSDVETCLMKEATKGHHYFSDAFLTKHLDPLAYDEHELTSSRLMSDLAPAWAPWPNTPEVMFFIRTMWITMAHKTWRIPLTATPLIPDLVTIVLDYLASHTNEEWPPHQVETYHRIHATDSPFQTMDKARVESLTREVDVYMLRTGIVPIEETTIEKENDDLPDLVDEDANEYNMDGGAMDEVD